MIGTIKMNVATKHLTKLYTNNLKTVFLSSSCTTNKINCKRKILHPIYPAPFNFNSRRKKCRNILGIETSCDDTGIAIINEDGVLLGEQLNSQTAYHVERGGINPPYARDLHLSNIHNVLHNTLQQANLTMNDIDIIATTTRPGLNSCLTVGLNHTINLINQYQTSFYPIHHMQAHALMPRYTHRVPFPYLVLLLSGGHCLLVVARAVNDFLLLGHSLDDAPGEAFDKIARRLRLKDVSGCEGLSGGQAVEKMAEGGDVGLLPLRHILNHHSDCNFSFSGLKVWTMQMIEKEEIAQGTQQGVQQLNNISDFCASFQHNVFRHIAKRLQRAMLYCQLEGLLDGGDGEGGGGENIETKDERRKYNLVLSGGVACNMYGRSLVEKVCQYHDFNLICPPPHLCTDNGVMAAWNGLEMLRHHTPFTTNPSIRLIQPKCVIGEDISNELRKARIKLPHIKF